MICLDPLALFLITIERLKCSKAISGMDGWDWMGRKSMKALILRAPLCGANNKVPMTTMMVEMVIMIVIIVMTKKLPKQHTNIMIFD